MKTKAVLGILAMLLWGCSSTTTTLPDTWSLKTASKSQNYYYCESCPAPTKLVNQVYVPLEPDEPVIMAKPVIEPKPVVTKRSYKKAKRHKNISSRIKKFKLNLNNVLNGVKNRE